MKTVAECDYCGTRRDIDSLRHDGARDRLICAERGPWWERVEKIRAARYEAEAFLRAERSSERDRVIV
jgi:hypothetical protein